MTKEKLLMLRKTLTNHFEKEWIRVSQSSAEAPVFLLENPMVASDSV
jgi:hypothetical protein